MSDQAGGVLAEVSRGIDGLLTSSSTLARGCIVAMQSSTSDRLAFEAIFPRREASQECGNGGVEMVCVERKKWAWADGFSLVSEATKRGHWGALGAARVTSGCIFPILLRNLPDLTIDRHS